MRRVYRLVVLSLAAGAIAAFGLALPAGAYPVTPPDTVQIAPTVGDPVTGTLPVTGSSSTPWVAVGIALVLGGLVLAVMASRRRTAHSLTS